MDRVEERLVKYGFDPEHAAQLAGALHGKNFKKAEALYEACRGSKAINPVPLKYGGM